MMQLTCTLLVTADMAAARKFYEEALGQQVESDLGANVSFKGGFALQSRESWEGLTGKRVEQPRDGQEDFELYFENPDFDAFVKHLEGFPIRYAHAVREQPWGQRVVRFYDPDGHLIEVGEDMACAVRRMAGEGMDAADICRRTMYPSAFIEAALDGRI